MAQEKAKDTPFNKGFQSKEAMEASIVKTVDEEDPEPAMSSNDPAVVAVPKEKMILITPRQTIPRAMIGGVTFSFKAGKKCLVPENVARHLEEKGVL